MKELKNIIVVWRWVNVLFLVSILIFMVTASSAEDLLSTVHALSYFLVLISFACMMVLPIYYAVTARNRIVVTIFAVVAFNAVGSILMYFCFNKSLKINE